ncbi:MAG TPA: efflux RND transporter periplasmic adaptor subunit [Nitrospirota bacterium]|nr:efflux RND transporter periplasmic adaptor subunit [Nitrospirota bacterium]
MKSRYFGWGTGLIVAFLLVISIGACSSNSKAKQSAQRAVPVAAGDVLQKDVPVQVKAIGNVESYNTVSIKAQISGEVEGVYFQEGQDVKKNDLLFKIDPRPYEAALRQAEATLARDRAQAKNAEEQAKRYEILVQKNYVSRDQYDQLRANADALAAVVDADKANVENNRLQLAYCTINSPINGRAGTVFVNAGNIIKANDIAMTTINQIMPIYVTFSVPEQNLANIKKYMAMGELKVEAIIPGEEKRSALGGLSFIDNAVDSTTGTIKLKGTFENRDHRLWPGQFVNVVLTLTTQRNAVVMPSAAMQAGQQGQYVFVIKPDFTVESRPVTVARTIDDMVVVAQGVTPGEKVVTDGQLQLVPGARVEIKGEQAQSGPERSGTSAKSQAPHDQ